MKGQRARAEDRFNENRSHMCTYKCQLVTQWHVSDRDSFSPEKNAFLSIHKATWVVQQLFKHTFTICSMYKCTEIN